MMDNNSVKTGATLSQTSSGKVYLERIYPSTNSIKLSLIKSDTKYSFSWGDINIFLDSMPGPLKG